MRLVLSRKGFDSSTAGCPSPILPDGRLLSLPIPRSDEKLRYDDVRFDDGTLGPVVEELSGGRLTGSDPCHLDPDLRREGRPRAPGWRALFGQAAASAGHLTNQEVGVGDVFLFFGWFRRTKRIDGRLRFVDDAPDLHVLFGWLQVGSVHPRPAGRPEELEPWMRGHPHADPDRPRANNLLFAASPRLRIGDRTLDPPGGGAFERLSEELVLTAEGHTRSVWRLPRFFGRRDPEERMTYHRRPDRWSVRDDHALVQTVGQGQEFVFELRTDRERAWLGRLLEGAA